MVNGQCTNAVEIARATAEETDDASTSYCSLPAINLEDSRQTPCTMLSSGMKIDGVGLYYDDRCNSADLSGCGARSIAGCRLCFYDKELWLARFPFDRVPDWEECPCCVADTLGVECATGGGGGGNDEEVIIGVSVAIAGVIAVACCLSCAFGTTIVRFVSMISNLAFFVVGAACSLSVWPSSSRHRGCSVAQAGGGQPLLWVGVVVLSMMLVNTSISKRGARQSMHFAWVSPPAWWGSVVKPLRRRSCDQSSDSDSDSRDACSHTEKCLENQRAVSKLWKTTDCESSHVLPL